MSALHSRGLGSLTHNPCADAHGPLGQWGLSGHMIPSGHMKGMWLIGPMGHIVLVPMMSHGCLFFLSATRSPEQTLSKTVLRCFWNRSNRSIQRRFGLDASIKPNRHTCSQHRAWSGHGPLEWSPASCTWASAAPKSPGIDCTIAQIQPLESLRPMTRLKSLICELSIGAHDPPNDRCWAVRLQKLAH